MAEESTHHPQLVKTIWLKICAFGKFDENYSFKRDNENVLT